MASLIQIKRSLTTATPVALANGEFGYTANGDVLYIGSNGSIVAIGGKRVPGVLTANQAHIADSNGLIDLLKTGNSTVNTIIGLANVTIANSTVSFSLKLPTSVQAAATDYYLAGDSTWRQLPGAGTFTIDQATDVTITSAANNQFLVYDNASSQWENHTLTGNTGQINAVFSGQDLTIALAPAITVPTSVTIGANVIASTTTVFVGNSTVNTTHSATGYAVANSTVSSTYGPFATIGANAGINATSHWVGNSTVNAVITQTALAVVNSTVSTSYGGFLTVGANAGINATSHWVGNSTVNAVVTSTSINIGNSTVNTVINSTAITTQDMTLSGNLIINGTTTTIDTTNLNVEDPLIKLAINNNATDAVDIGIYGLYDTSGSLDLFGGIFRDATDGKWKVFKDLQAEPTTTVNLGGAGYAVGTLVAALESSSVAITGGTITGITDLAVADGGTGVSSFTNNGVFYGNGTTAIGFATGLDGTIMQSVAGVPTFGTLDGGTF